MVIPSKAAQAATQNAHQEKPHERLSVASIRLFCRHCIYLEYLLALDAEITQNYSSGSILFRSSVEYVASDTSSFLNF